MNLYDYFGTAVFGVLLGILSMPDKTFKMRMLRLKKRFLWVSIPDVIVNYLYFFVIVGAVTYIDRASHPGDFLSALGIGYLCGKSADFVLGHTSNEEVP